MQKTKDGEVKMVTLMLFGDAEHCQKVRNRYWHTTCSICSLHSIVKLQHRAGQQ